MQLAIDHLVENAGASVAHAFVTAVDASFSRLLEMPHLGRTQEWLSASLHGCRRILVESPFEAYHIYYSPTDARIDVIRVLHGARDAEAAFAVC